jgi:hypothetical protein
MFTLVLRSCSRRMYDVIPINHSESFGIDFGATHVAGSLVHPKRWVLAYDIVRPSAYLHRIGEPVGRQLLQKRALPVRAAPIQDQAWAIDEQLWVDKEVHGEAICVPFVYQCPFLSAHRDIRLGLVQRDNYGKSPVSRDVWIVLRKNYLEAPPLGHVMCSNS